MSRQHWVRRWLPHNAERILRERTLERVFLDQFARDALALLQDRETVPELVRRLNANAPHINVMMREPWTVARLCAEWAEDCADAAVETAKSEGVSLRRSRARRVITAWLMRNGAEMADRAPQKWTLPRPLATERFMAFLVNKIRMGGNLMLAEAAGVDVGEKLSDKTRNYQIHLMRFLRSHAVLKNRDGDGPWREAALLDTWTGLGFSVDGIEDIPKAGPIEPVGPRRFELDTAELSEARAHPAVPLSRFYRT